MALINLNLIFLNQDKLQATPPPKPENPPITHIFPILTVYPSSEADLRDLMNPTEFKVEEAALNIDGPWFDHK